MKRITFRFISIFLVFAMLLPISAIAVDRKMYVEEGLSAESYLFSGYDEAQIARDTYANLSPEARLLFDQVIANDRQLLAFHLANVDNTFNIDAVRSRSTAPASRSLSVLSAWRGSGI